MAERVEFNQGDEPSLNDIAMSLLEPGPGAEANPPEDQPAEGADNVDDRDPAQAEADDIGETGAEDVGEPLDDDDADAELLAADGDDDGEILDIELDDDFLIEVKADGKTSEVTLAELKRSYSGETAIQSRLEAAAIKSKEVAEKTTQLDQVMQMYGQKLQQLDGILKQNAEPEVEDWDALYQDDPVEWTRRREVMRSQREQQEAVRVELEQLNGQVESEKAEVMKGYMAEQATALRDKIPEFSDPDKAPKVHAAMMKFGEEEFGFTADEINSVVDHRPLYMLYRLWQASQTGQKETVTKQKRRRIKPRLRPGSGTTAPGAKTQAQKRRAAAYAKAKRTGHPDDVAKTLLA